MNEQLQAWMEACRACNSVPTFTEEWTRLRAIQKDLWHKLSPNERMGVSAKVFTIDSEFPARMQ